MAIILVTNDDGISSPGIRLLAQALEGIGEVWVIAPEREASSVSHAITLNQPLRAEEVSPRRYAVCGTPTDCVYLGVVKLLPDKPALLVSGINRGVNLADDITYSGTVAGAMEGALLGIPSFAISLDEGSSDFNKAVLFAKALSSKLISSPLPEGIFINVNVPAGEVKGVRVTRQGMRVSGGSVLERIDPRRKVYYWIGPQHYPKGEPEDTDIGAFTKGYISITPLKIDLTDHKLIGQLKESWKRELSSFLKIEDG
jgi:5'-nucleotidase